MVDYRNDEIIYGLDFLSDYFKSETILLKLFNSVVRNNDYEKLDIIVSSVYNYLCDIIDSSDSFSIYSHNSDDNKLFSSFKLNDHNHFDLDDLSKKKLKSLIKFNLSYDKESPIIFSKYDSKYLSKDNNNSLIYLFFSKDKEIVEFHSDKCLFYDYRDTFIIDEQQQKYRDIINYNIFDKDE